MICPKCKAQTEQLFFMSTGVMCRACRQGNNSPHSHDDSPDNLPLPPVQSDPEHDYPRSQGDGVGRLWRFIAWCLFFVAGCWVIADAARHRAMRWLKWRRVCAWCVPKRRVGGNPFARNVTHTACPSCARKFLAQPISSGRSQRSCDSSVPTVSARAAAGESSNSPDSLTRNSQLSYDFKSRIQ